MAHSASAQRSKQLVPQWQIMTDPLQLPIAAHRLTTHASNKGGRWPRTSGHLVTILLNGNWLIHGNYGSGCFGGFITEEQTMCIYVVKQRCFASSCGLDTIKSGPVPMSKKCSKFGHVWICTEAPHFASLRPPGRTGEPHALPKKTREDKQWPKMRGHLCGASHIHDHS